MNDAKVTTTRTCSGDGSDSINIEIEWGERRLKLEMTLENFGLMITGRSACEAIVKRFKEASLPRPAHAEGEEGNI